MKAEKINELYEWVEWEDLNPEEDIDSLEMYRRVSDDILDGTLEFDIVDNKSDGEYIICSVYKDVEWKEWYSCIVNRDVLWCFATPRDFVRYVASLYDRAMEILDS